MHNANHHFETRLYAPRSPAWTARVSMTLRVRRQARRRAVPCSRRRSAASPPRSSVIGPTPHRSSEESARSAARAATAFLVIAEPRTEPGASIADARPLPNARCRARHALPRHACKVSAEQAGSKPPARSVTRRRTCAIRTPSAPDRRPTAPMTHWRSRAACVWAESLEPSRPHQAIRRRIRVIALVKYSAKTTHAISRAALDARHRRRVRHGNIHRVRRHGGQTIRPSGARRAPTVRRNPVHRFTSAGRHQAHAMRRYENMVTFPQFGLFVISSSLAPGCRSRAASRSR